MPAGGSAEPSALSWTLSWEWMSQRVAWRCFAPTVATSSHVCLMHILHMVPMHA
jgi:hypothetical protein